MFKAIAHLFQNQPQPNAATPLQSAVTPQQPQITPLEHCACHAAAHTGAAFRAVTANANPDLLTVWFLLPNGWEYGAPILATLAQHGDRAFVAALLRQYLLDALKAATHLNPHTMRDVYLPGGKGTLQRV
jgi:hypothetical protein